MEGVQPLKIGVIGFGKLGLLHAGQFNGLDDVKLTCVADTSSTTLNFLKSKMNNVSVYSDYRQLLNKESLDGVVIATPTDSHVAIATEAINRDIPVFIEKPLSLSGEQAAGLIETLKAKPVVNMVGYMGRYTDTFIKAKDLIASGVLGELQMFRSSMYIGQLFKKGKGWRYNRNASGGGVLITQNAHVVDKLVWMFGDPDWVSGHIRHLYSDQVEDSAHAYFKFKNGLTGFLDSSWSAKHYRTVTISIHVQGENGTLDVNDDDVRLFLEKGTTSLSPGWHIWKKPDLYEGVAFDIGGPHYTRQANEFLSAIRGNNKINSTVFSAYNTQLTIDAIYKSASQDGFPIKIEKVVPC